MTTSATPVGIDGSSKKTVQNAASDGFVSNFSGAAFCLPTSWWASCLLQNNCYSDQFVAYWLKLWLIESVASCER